jgi:hypothetical protein
MERQAQYTANSLITFRQAGGESAQEFITRLVERQQFIASTMNVVAIPRNIIEQAGETKEK